MDAITQLRVQRLSSQVSSPSPAVYRPQPTNTFTTVVAKYPAVFQPHLHSQNVEHDKTHHILQVHLLVLTHADYSREAYSCKAGI